MFHILEHLKFNGRSQDPNVCFVAYISKGKILHDISNVEIDHQMSQTIRGGCRRANWRSNIHIVNQACTYISMYVHMLPGY